MVEAAGFILGGKDENQISMLANGQIWSISGWSSIPSLSLHAGVEPAKFQQKLTFAFKNQSNLDSVCNPFTDLICIWLLLLLAIKQVVGEFSRGFSEYINDPVRFRTSLVATKIREGANVMYISTEITLIYSLMLLHSDSFFTGVDLEGWIAWFTFYLEWLPFSPRWLVFC